MSVLKYKDSSGNWIGVSSGGGGKLYRHYIQLQGEDSGETYIAQAYITLYSTKSTSYTADDAILQTGEFVISSYRKTPFGTTDWSNYTSMLLRFSSNLKIFRAITESPYIDLNVLSDTVTEL